MIALSVATITLCWMLLQLPGLPGPGLLLVLLPPLLLLGWCLGGARAVACVLAGGWTCLVAGAVLAERLPAGRVNEDVLVQVTICDFPRQSAGVTRFVVDTGAVAMFPPLPRRLNVGWYEDAPAPAIGEHWQLVLRLRGARGLYNAAGFDFERWLFTQRIGGSAYVRASAENRRLAAPAAHPCRLAALRGRLAAQLEAVVGDHPAAGHLLGLAVGARHRLTEADWLRLRRTGTSHLMAISGLHVGLAAGCWALLAGLVARLALRCGWPMAPRRLALAAALLGGTGYAALAGFAIPTLRALAMLWTAGLLLSLRRRVRAADALAAAGFVVVVLDPLAVLQAGFWLSFAGVALCLLAAALLPPAPARQPLRRRAGRALGALLLLQLLLGLGLAPLTIAWFGETSLMSLPANLLAVPVFSLLLVPLVLAGTLLLPLWPWAAAQLLGGAAALLGPLLSALGWLAAVPGAALELEFAGAAARTLALAAAVLLVWPPPYPARWLAALALAGASLTAPRPLPYGTLEVRVLDVGQGLSVLVRTRSRSLLYDAGPAAGDSDAGSRVALPALRQAGIRRLDRLLISHQHLDHRGGAESVLAAHPGALLLAPADWGLPARRFQRCRAGLAWRWDGFTFELLHPDEARVPWSHNDGSCVLLVSGPGGSVLLPGDLERLGERYLLRERPPGQVDLLLAPHHGSRTSSTSELVAATRPAFVVVSAGLFNRFGHPDPAVVARWSEAGACVLDTGRDGAVAFRLDGRGGALRPWRARADARRLWTSPDPGPSSCQ
jgi:competence protein ComEC